ncbi:MAG: hypothetical protein ACO3ZW_06110 [Opitutales bacterium]
MENMARWLLVASVVAILLGPVIIMMLAFSVDGLFIGGALLIMGALGLYAGMKSLNRTKADSQ